MGHSLFWGVGVILLVYQVVHTYICVSMLSSNSASQAELEDKGSGSI